MVQPGSEAIANDDAEFFTIRAPYLQFFSRRPGVSRNDFPFKNGRVFMHLDCIGRIYLGLGEQAKTTVATNGR